LLQKYICMKTQILTLSSMVLLSLALGIRFKTYAQRTENFHIVIQNTSDLDFNEKVVEIPWQEILKSWADADTGSMLVVDETLTQLPMQFETKGTGSVQNLLVQVSVPANKTIKLSIINGTRHKITAKTYCRFVPERYDDFAWENDRIAFRMYGKALEATTFNAYGIDVWAKRTSNLIINKWYKSEDYHNDHGDGLDFYGVGYSLGAGNCSPFVNDSIYYSKNYTRYEVLDNGPLRSTFKLFYDSWPVAGYTVNVVKNIQLDAGEQLNKIEACFEFSGTDTLPVAIGINKKAGADVKLMDEQHSFIGYWLPRDSIHGTIGVGCVFSESNSQMNYLKKHLLYVQNVKSKLPLIYYTGAAWDKAGVFTDELMWFTYLKEYSLKIKQPLKIEVL